MPSTVDAIRRRKKLNLLAATDLDKFSKERDRQERLKRKERIAGKKKIKSLGSLIKKGLKKIF